MVSVTSFTQKVNLKKEVVSIDDTPVFLLKYDFGMNIITIYNLDNKKLMILPVETYYDSQKITSGNPEGRVVYYDASFLTADIDKCEFNVPGGRKQLAKYLIEYNLIKEGELDEKAVQQFVKIHGKKFSEERGRSTTIIIKSR